MNTREAAAVLERLPSLAAFGLPSPSAILLQNAAKAPAQPIATRPQAATLQSSALYEAASPTPAASNSFPQLRRGRPRLDRSSLRCAHCGSTESTQWRTSSLGPRTLCNACGLRAFRKKQRETRESHGTDKRPKMEELSPTSTGMSLTPTAQPQSPTAKMSVSFLTS